jgi:guanine nucleotide-binding protein subunit beta-2-like 1 protein
MEADKEKVTYDFIEMGVLKGHNDRVTCMVAGHSLKEGEDTPLLISGSRDKTLIIWKLYGENKDGYYGYPYKSLTGHNHFVSDLALANENNMVISSSWDKTLRLWDLKTGKTVRRFVGHTKEVFTVALSQDNRQIISAGADQGIKLWNTLGDCKFTTESHNHNDWVSCIRYSPLQKTQTKVDSKPYFASVGWDGRLKIWNTNFQIRYSFKAHKSNINALSISPNFKYVATGGKDKTLNVWEVMDLRAPSRDFDAEGTINQITFNQKCQWVAAATEHDIKVWDLMSADSKPIAELLHAPAQKEGKKVKMPECTSLTWNSLGKKLFAGFADGTIRVWHAEQRK